MHVTNAYKIILFLINMGFNDSMYRVAPNSKLEIGLYDSGMKLPQGKDLAKSEFKNIVAELDRYQQLMYAEGKNKLLVVLQARDTGGKDSTIRSVFGDLNPQGVHVASFKKPTEKELAHDYLWRVHPHVPGKGEISVFNRSHYEDVLPVRVHNLVSEEVWRKRYGDIKNFEDYLVNNGVTIRKFFLNLSSDEQKERLEERLDIPEKNWKFNAGDLGERAKWHEYTKAYEEAISKTSTENSPWYIIPADRKWVRNYIIGNILLETFKDMNMEYPEPDPETKRLIDLRRQGKFEIK